jgi:hypothetical protein
MDLLGCYANDWTCMAMSRRKLMSKSKLTVDLVQVDNVIAELPTQDNFIVEFIPSCQGRELWARELGNGRKIQTVNRQACQVDCERGKNSRNDSLPRNALDLGQEGRNSFHIDSLL